MVTLPHRHLLGDLAFEAGTAKHTFKTPAVERTSDGTLQTGTYTAQSAELLTTFRSHRCTHWILGHFEDLTGQHLIKHGRGQSTNVTHYINIQ